MKSITAPWSRSALAALLLALLAFTGADHAAAQGAATTGQIRGRVVNPAGQPVASVSVAARNLETGLTRGVLTDAKGQYALRLLPPGMYEVEATMIGRTGEVAENIRVVVGNATTVDLVLAESAVELEGIVVEGVAPVDATEGGVRKLVEEQAIDELPSLGRDFTNFIQLSPMVAPDPGATTGGKFSIAGMRASQTNIQIDGVDANNSFFGENRGGSRIPFVFSLESIKEFQIITNGYDVEHGRYSGGIVNAVTKGGGNEFQGSAYLNYRGDQLTASDFAGDPISDYEVLQASALFSGPIVEDKLFFLASVDGQRRREPNRPLLIDRFAPGGLEADPVLYEETQRFLEILEQRYGVENPASSFTPFQTTNDALTLFGRIDWTINDSHRLSVRHNFSNFENANEWTDRYDYHYGVSRAERYEDISNSFVTELQSVLAANTYNVFRFQFSDERRPRTGNDLRPALVVDLSSTYESPGSINDQIAYGGSFLAFQNNLEEQKFQLIDNLTHVVGDHTLKLGTNALFTDYSNRFLADGAGTFRFRSLEDFAAFRPASYERNLRAGDEPVPEANFGVFEWALYAQDEWVVNPRLTATFGLRYDIQRFSDDPGRVVDAERAFGLQTGIAPDDNDNISPRLALAYDLSGDGHSVIRGGVGYFYGSVPGVLGGNVLQTQQPVLTLECPGSIIEGDPDAPPLPEEYAEWDPEGFDNPTRCGGSAALTGVPEYAFWADGFEYPETFKANVGYERLLSADTRINLDVLYSQSTNLYTVENLNLRDAQFQLDTEGGRRIYQPETVFDPTASSSTANELRSRRNLDLGRIYLNTNNGRSESFVGTVELAHQFTDETAVTASYSFTRAYDNSSFSCCTSDEGYTSVDIGAFGPNQLGDVGDEDYAWGRSEFARTHSFVVSALTELPWDIKLNAFWRLQSGRPWGPEASGDLNADGIRFNDRPYIYAPEDLPLAYADPAEEAAARERYASFLNEWDCVGEYVGEIIPRNTCDAPWTNLLDVRLSKAIDTGLGDRAELQVDLFNVLNGLNSEWGQVMGIYGSSRNLLEVAGYDAETNQILYSVPAEDRFASEEIVGENLLLQFQAQIGVKYYF